MNRHELENKIKSICRILILRQGYLSSIDVLKELNYLSEDDYMAWRFGKIPFLEKVCKANLSRLQFINQTIKKTARTMNLKPSPTVYHKWGKGVKNKLFFSKSGNENIERAYATHYVDVGRINELKRDGMG